MPPGWRSAHETRFPVTEALPEPASHGLRPSGCSAIVALRLRRLDLPQLRHWLPAASGLGKECHDMATPCRTVTLHCEDGRQPCFLLRKETVLRLGRAKGNELVLDKDGLKSLK